MENRTAGSKFVMNEMVRIDTQCQPFVLDNAVSRVAKTVDRPAEKTPFGGWATLVAVGLLARGSLFTPSLPSFPVALWGVNSPLTVAGAARVLHPVPFYSPKGTATTWLCNGLPLYMQGLSK